MALTLCMSLFDEALITFTPRGYTLHWYGQILDTFGAPRWFTQPWHSVDDPFGYEAA